MIFGFYNTTLMKSIQNLIFTSYNTLKQANHKMTDLFHILTSLYTNMTILTNLLRIPSIVALLLPRSLCQFYILLALTELISNLVLKKIQSNLK